LLFQLNKTFNNHLTELNLKQSKKIIPYYRPNPGSVLVIKKKNSKMVRVHSDDSHVTGYQHYNKTKSATYE
jgi:thymidylate synthase